MADQGQEPEPLITECPHCDTRFRVTENQLILAEGRVRCGACLAVFLGTDHLHLTGEIATSEEADRTLDEVLSELDEDELEENSEDSSEDLRTENIPDLPVEEIASEDVDAEAAKPQPAEEENFSEDNIQDTQEFPIIESHGAGLLQSPGDFSAIGPVLENEVPEVSHQETFDASESVAGKDKFDPVTGSESQSGSETEESVAVQDNVGAFVGLAPFTIVDPKAQATEIAAPAGDVEAGEVEAGDVEQDVVADGQHAGELPAGETQYQELPEQLLYIEKKRSRWVPGLFLLGLLAITVQVFYYQFEIWGKDQQMRPLYAFVCEQIGCQLPVIRSLDDIRIRSKNVRSHNVLPDVLSVEALIVNEAEFTQPFPIVELRFTSMLGQLITSYRFQPADYLDGELKGVAEMEPMQPVRIAFEVPDPGSQAANYLIVFY